MYNWVNILIWPLAATIIARTFLRAIAIIVLYLVGKEEKVNDNG